MSKIPLELVVNGASLVSTLRPDALTLAEARTRKLISPSRGVRYAVSAADRGLAIASAASLVCGPKAVLADVSAARLWGLPLPPWLARLEGTQTDTVAVAAGGARPQRRGVRGRRLIMPDDHLTQIHRLKVTTPARTWLDCAALVPIEHLVAMGDFALRSGLTSLAELELLVHWAHRRRGVTNARRVISLLDPKSESPGESITRAHLVLAGIPRPQCNLEIVSHGEWIARVDLAWSEQRVVAEYDGIVHAEDKQRRHDATRRNLLQDQGWMVIVFTANDLIRPWRMVALVDSALRSRSRISAVNRPR